MMRVSGGSRHRSRNNDSGGGALILIGLGIFLIGLIGAFFGSLIRAAVGRQREFLADASAVQFTRNPEGISGALKRIGGFSAGSKKFNPVKPGTIVISFSAPLYPACSLLIPHSHSEFGGSNQTGLTNTPIQIRFRKVLKQLRN